MKLPQRFMKMLFERLYKSVVNLYKEDPNNCLGELEKDVKNLMVEKEVNVVEEDCFVVMCIQGVNDIEYVFYDTEKREISLTNDIEFCSHFKLTESTLVHEVIVTMFAVGMTGLPCLLRTREDEDKKLLECISMPLEKLALFAKKDVGNLVN